MRSPFRRTINYCESLAKIGNCREVGQLRSWRRNVSPLIESSVEYLPCFTRQLHIIYSAVWNSQLPGIYVERQPQRNEVNVAKREGRTTSGGRRRERNKKTLKGRLTASSRRKEPKNANHSHPLPPPAPQPSRLVASPAITRSLQIPRLERAFSQSTDTIVEGKRSNTGRRIESPLDKSGNSRGGGKSERKRIRQSRSTRISHC